MLRLDHHGPNQTFKTLTCRSSNGLGIDAEASGVVFDTFTIGPTNGGCVLGNGNTLTFKTGHCTRELSTTAAIVMNGTTDKVDTTLVDAASGPCFDFEGDNGSLTNSTAAQCGTGGSGEGILWNGAGTATITGNKTKYSFGDGLSVNVSDGTFTITNNNLKNSQFGDCAFVGTPDALTMTGNKVQGCWNSAITVDVNNNPKVSTNQGLDASGNAQRPDDVRALRDHVRHRPGEHEHA